MFVKKCIGNSLKYKFHCPLVSILQFQNQFSTQIFSPHILLTSCYVDVDCSPQIPSTNSTYQQFEDDLICVRVEDFQLHFKVVKMKQSCEATRPLIKVVTVFLSKSCCVFQLLPNTDVYFGCT